MYNQSPLDLLTDDIFFMIEENVERMEQSDPISQKDAGELSVLEK